MQAEKLAAEEAIRSGLYGVGGSQVCSTASTPLHRYQAAAVEPSLDLWPLDGHHLAQSHPLKPQLRSWQLSQVTIVVGPTVLRNHDTSLVSPALMNRLTAVAP